MKRSASPSCLRGDTQYPDVNDEPSPERMAAPEPVVAEAPVEEIDTSNWKSYGDEEPEEAVAKKITPLGVQWDKLMAAMGKGWQWFRQYRVDRSGGRCPFSLHTRISITWPS